MSTLSSTKYQAVRSSLEAAIRSGEFQAGEQLPAEQALAKQYGVSLMTARRVVCDLVTEDLLERRARKGTFVRHHAVERITTTTLNLVVPAYDNSFQRLFLNQAVRMADEKGWRANIIRLSAGQQDLAVRALQNDEMALVMLDEVRPQSGLGLAMRGSKGKVVSIGRDMTSIEVPSILVETSRAHTKALHYLRDLGHRHIACLIQDMSQSFRENHRQAWQRAVEGFYSPEEADERAIWLQTPNFQCPSFDAYDAVRELLDQKRLPVTALICFGEEVTQGALAACRIMNHPVPEAISVVNILDAPAMVFAHPPVTSVDVDFKRQIEIAFRILETPTETTSSEMLLHQVEPLLLERESARTISGNS